MMRTNLGEKNQDENERISSIDRCFHSNWLIMLHILPIYQIVYLVDKEIEVKDVVKYKRIIYDAFVLVCTHVINLKSTRTNGAREKDARWDVKQMTRSSTSVRQ